MVSAGIAYLVLKEQSPNTIQSALTVLKEHPFYEDRWASRIAAVGGSQDDQNMHLFMLAARWPDDVRGDTHYDHEEWHFTNIPFVPPGQPSTARPRPPKAVNIVSRLAALPGEFHASNDEEGKAVALCWIFHLTGDIHQPLHTVSLFSETYPKGDRGGNSQHIRVKTGSATIDLHKFWDGLILGIENFQPVRNRAISLHQDSRFQRSMLTELSDRSPSTWAEKESASAAREHVYLFGKLKTSSKKDDRNAPVLPPEYVAKATETAERRMVLAGNRLAESLRELMK